MIARWLVSAVALLTLSAAIAHAAVLDSVRTVANKAYTGKLTELTPLKVVIEHAGTSEEIPTNEILSLNFSGEPGGLATVRNHVIKKEYQDAVASLDMIERKHPLTGLVPDEERIHFPVADGAQNLLGLRQPRS